MTNAQEELSLREQYPLYRAWQEDDEVVEEEDEMTRAEFEREWRENR